MIKQFKKNQGMVLPLTVVIVFFVSFLAIAIVSMTSFSIKMRINQINTIEHQIVLENTMYSHLNEFTQGLNSDKSVKEKYLDFNTSWLNESFLVKITFVESNNYHISLKTSNPYSEVLLEVTIFLNEDTTYKITKWGFV